MPVAVFVIPFGLAFGAAAVEQGVSPAEALLMSAAVFAGASQFAVLDLWQIPLPLVSILLVTLAVNARLIILGAALSPWVNALPPRQRFLSLLLLSDANFADSHAALRDGDHDVGRLVGGGLILWGAWMIGTALGAFAGASAQILSALGVDVVMVAFFAAMVTGDLKRRPLFVPVGVASAVAIATLPILPVGWNIIAGAVAGGLVGAMASDR